MKVKELIVELSRHNPEDMVIVDGYEGGVNEMTIIQCVRVVLNVNDEWYYGRHEIIDDADENLVVINAIRLS